jgi:hypothetical protein
MSLFWRKNLLWFLQFRLQLAETSPTKSGLKQKNEKLKNEVERWLYSPNLWHLCKIWKRFLFFILCLTKTSLSFLKFISICPNSTLEDEVLNRQKKRGFKFFGRAVLEGRAVYSDPPRGGKWYWEGGLISP